MEHQETEVAHRAGETGMPFRQRSTPDSQGLAELYLRVRVVAFDPQNVGQSLNEKRDFRMFIAK